MPKAQVIYELGAPNVMKWKEWVVSDPAPGEVGVVFCCVFFTCNYLIFYNFSPKKL